MHTTDIPEWCYAEAFGPEVGRQRYRPTPTGEDLARFLECSPIAHVEGVVAKTLFLVGAQDRRVPPSDPLHYVQVLRSRGLDTEVLLFPSDNHPLSKPQTEIQVWVRVLRFARDVLSL